jgi:hypothetical protein
MISQLNLFGASQRLGIHRESTDDPPHVSSTFLFVKIRDYTRKSCEVVVNAQRGVVEKILADQFMLK